VNKEFVPGEKLPAVTAEEVLSVWGVGKGCQSKAGGLDWQRGTAKVHLGRCWSASASGLVFRVEGRWWHLGRST